MSFDVQKYSQEEKEKYTKIIKASKKIWPIKKRVTITGKTTLKYKLVNLCGGYYVYKYNSRYYRLIKSDYINNTKKLANFVEIDMNISNYKTIESISYFAYDNSKNIEFNRHNPEGIISNLVFNNNGELESISATIDGNEIITIEEAHSQATKEIEELHEKMNKLILEKEEQITNLQKSFGIKISSVVCQIANKQIALRHAKKCMTPGHAVIQGSLQLANVGEDMVNQLEAIKNFRNK